MLGGRFIYLHVPYLTDEFVCIVPCRSKNFLQETMLQKRPVQRVFDVTVREISDAQA